MNPTSTPSASSVRIPAWLTARLIESPSGAVTIWCLFVIFVPFRGVLVYLIARGGGMTQRAIEQQQRMQDQQAEYVRSVVTTSGGGSSTDQIASAKQLLDAGTITQAEFDQLKAKALA
jgi:uncharacterized SAM-binding protein YcdF (DUF218 family)